MRIILSILWLFSLLSLLSADTHHVSISGGTPGYDPNQLTIEGGDIVIWTNDSNFHTVTGDNLNWGSENLLNEDTFQHQFNEVGEFPYHCNIHNSMAGNISVEDLDVYGCIDPDACNYNSDAT